LTFARYLYITQNEKQGVPSRLMHECYKFYFFWRTASGICPYKGALFFFQKKR